MASPIPSTSVPVTHTVSTFNRRDGETYYTQAIRQVACSETSSFENQTVAQQCATALNDLTATSNYSVSVVPGFFSDDYQISNSSAPAATADQVVATEVKSEPRIPAGGRILY